MSVAALPFVLTVSEVAAASGVASSAVRFYLGEMRSGARLCEL
ncbi:hypothetical protein [Actinoplanes sp. NPDC023714]